MALTLTPGREMRLEGAPDQLLPPAQDKLQALAYRLLEEDEEGVLFSGDVRNAIPVANQMLMEANTARMDAAVARGTARAGRRADARQAARGVNPESLPADEYGSVSARTVQTANMSPDAQEAELMQYQDLADAEIRDMREGRFHGANAQARQFEQDYGLSTTPSATGKTDLDYLREIQQHQGFLRTGSGEMIPMGPTPTPEAIASRRDLNEWANENPGTERQALYDPQAYEEFREGVRNDIRDRAQDDMATYGTGPTWRLEEAARAELDAAPGEVGAFAGNVAGASVGGPLVAPGLASQDLARSEAARMLEAREARAASEDRVRQAQRGRFYEEKLRAEAGLPAAPLPENPTVQDLERLAFRSRYDRRQADLDARRERVQMNARLAGGQPTAGSRAAVQNMMQGRDRFDELIGRLGDQRMTDWQRAGIIAGLAPQAQTANPTPLGVDAVGLQNAMRLAGQQAMGGMDPGGLREQAAYTAALQLPPEQRVAMSKRFGEPMGTGLSSEWVESRYNHWFVKAGMSTEAERRRGFVGEMMARGYPEGEAERYVDVRMNAADPAVARPAEVPGDVAEPTVRVPQGGGRGGPVAQPPDWTRDRGPRGRGASRRR